MPQGYCYREVDRMWSEKSAEGIVSSTQARLLRHSNVERRSERIG